MPAPDASAPTAADASVDGGPASGGTVDAGGPSLPPYPPATCADASWAPAVPGHAVVNRCGGQLSLSSTFTTNGVPPPFHRCGTLGPEIETDLRLSPDGGHLATLTGAGTVRLFATDDWREIGQLAPLTGRFDAFAFSPDGTRLATLSMERGELTVWDAADGTSQTTFTGKGTAGAFPVLRPGLAFSRDGRRVASSLGTIVDLDGGSTVTLNNGLGLGSPIDQMAFTMCDAKLYVRSYFQSGDSNQVTQVSLYDTHTGQIQGLFGAWDSYFGGSAMSQDGRLLAIASNYETSDTSGAYDLSIYRGDTGERIDHRPSRGRGTIQAFTPDDTALVVLNGTQLDQWRIADGVVVTSWFFGSGYRVLGFPNPAAMAIGTPTGIESFSLSKSDLFSGSHNFAATAASWTADGTVGAAIAADGRLFHVWQESDEADVCAPASPGPTAAATSFALSGDGRLLGIGKTDGVVDLFDTATGLRRSSIETLQGPVATTAVSWDGRTTAARMDAFAAPIQLWSTGGYTLNSVVPAGTPSRWSRFALSPDGGTVVTNDGLSSTSLIDVTTGAVHPVLPFSFDPWATGAPFSPDSSHLAGWAGTLATWRVADAVRDDVLLAPADLAPANPANTSVSLGLASDWSVAAALNGTSLVLWDPRTGTELRKLDGFASGFGGHVLGVGGSTVAIDQHWVHTAFSGEYYVDQLYDVATGAQLRAFDADNGNRQLLLGVDGSRAYTLEPPDVIAWCR